MQLAVIGLAKDKNGYDKPSIDAVKKLREDAQATPSTGTTCGYGVTGTAAAGADSQESGNKARRSSGSPRSC